MAFSAVSVIRGPGEIAAMVVEVTKRIFTRPVPVPRVHRAGLVHHQRHADADDPGLDPVRRGHLAPGRQPDRPARRPVLRRRDRGARRRPRGRPDRGRADHRRRRRLGDLLRPGRPQDPRGDRRHGGPRRRPAGAAGRAARGGHHVRRADDQRHRDRRRHRRRLLLHRDRPGRLRGRVPVVLHRAGQPARPLHRDGQGRSSSAGWPRSSAPTRASTPAAGPAASAGRSTSR